jgi:16S rRNA U516 pseudouridylate synthase RsuA-like enzyme
MIEAVGSRVRKLVRTGIGPVQIGTLEIGKWRELSAAEIAALRRQTPFCDLEPPNRAASEQSRII